MGDVGIQAGGQSCCCCCGLTDETDKSLRRIHIPMEERLSSWQTAYGLCVNLKASVCVCMCVGCVCVSKTLNWLGF